MFQLSHIEFTHSDNSLTPKSKLPRLFTTIDHETSNADIAMLLAQYDYNQTLLGLMEKNRSPNASKTNYAGVFLVDPFMHLPHYLTQLSNQGFNGIANYPSIAFYGEDFSNQLEEVNLGLTREFERLAAAQEAGFEVIACLPASSTEALTQMALELLQPTKWLIHSGLQNIQTSNTVKLKAPSQHISQLEGEKFHYQRNGDLSTLPPEYQGLARASWW